MGTAPSAGFRVAIDAFRLTTELHTSGFYFVRQLINALAASSGVARLNLFLPRRRHEALSDLGIVPSSKLHLYYFNPVLRPEQSFAQQVLWTQFAVPRLVAESAGCDLLILPYHHTPLHVGGAGRVATVIHDTYGVTLNSKWKKSLYQHLWMFWTASRGADALVPISSHTQKTFLERYGAVSRRVAPFVWNAVSGRAIGEEQGLACLASEGLRRHGYFLAMGAPGLRKGFDRVVASYQEYRAQGGSLGLAVFTSPVYSTDVRRALSAAGVESCSTVLEDVSDKQRDCLYWGAAAFVFLSRGEGFGYPIVEAMLQGCPIVVTAIGAARELMGLGDGGTGDGGWSPLEVARQMKSVEAYDAGERSALAAALRERAALFSPEGYGDRFLAAIRHVTNGSRSTCQ